MAKSSAPAWCHSSRDTLAQIGVWGRRYLPASGAGREQARVLEEGGPRLWDELMAELRATHVA